MAEEKQNKAPVEQDVNQLRKVRREKLSELQQAGEDPFVITKYDQTHHTDEVKSLYEAYEIERIAKHYQLQGNKIGISLSYHFKLFLIIMLKYGNIRLIAEFLSAFIIKSFHILFPQTIIVMITCNIYSYNIIFSRKNKSFTFQGNASMPGKTVKTVLTGKKFATFELIDKKQRFLLGYVRKLQKAFAMQAAVGWSLPETMLQIGRILGKIHVYIP